MRCKNCGWENPANKANCEKCNASLTVVSASEADGSNMGNNPKKTSRSCAECGYPVREDEQSCPRCGHLLGDVKLDEEPKPVEAPEPKLQDTPAEEEPKPVEAPEPKLQETPAKEEPKPVEDPEPTPIVCESAEKASADTINPWVNAGAEQVQSPKCSLTLISGNDDSTNRYSGNVIQLHRGNTEPDNQTITSKTQAELIFENDKWYIQDKSALKTTYVYAGEKKELKPGDVIVLGNRLFEFNCVSTNHPE